MSAPTFETDKVLITLIEDSIFRVFIKKHAKLDLADLDANYFFFKEYIQDKKIPFLVVYDKNATLVKGLTEKFNENGPANRTKKEAIVISSFSRRLRALFLSNKSNHPTKLFSNEVEAIKWLKS